MRSFQGEALRQSGLAREDVFIETKVWRSSHGYERTIKVGAICAMNCYDMLGDMVVDIHEIFENI